MSDVVVFMVVAWLQSLPNLMIGVVAAFQQQKPLEFVLLFLLLFQYMRPIQLANLSPPDYVFISSYHKKDHRSQELIFDKLFRNTFCFFTSHML